MHQCKAAVFGTGFVGRIHLDSLRRLGYVQIVAIAESEIEKAKRLAEEFYVPRAESDYRRILEDPEITAIHICTPNFLHYSMARDALRAGKHVLCEKPLAISVAEARELVDLARPTRLRNCTFHNLRFYPMVDLGEILVVEGTYSQDWLLLETDWNWRLESKTGGPWRCFGCYGGFRSCAVSHGRAHARLLHRQPGFGGTQKPAQFGNLWH